MSLALNFLAPRGAGFNLIDCEVRDRSVVYLLAREDYTQRPNWRDSLDPPPDGKLAKRVLGLRIDSPDEKKWGHAHLTGLDLSVFSMAFLPEPKVVVVDIGTKAWAQSADGNGFEPEIKSRAEGGINRGAVTRAKTFGQHQLISNTARQIFARMGPGQWDLVGLPMNKVTGEFTGFEDFDRFTEGNMYAVGGEGDIWHFDGTTWRQCAFPTNWGLSAVCCGGDGQVYVCAGAGSVYRGSGDRWKLIHQGDYTLPFKDMVWYEGKVWCTSDYGLWTIEGDTLTEADVPSDVKICSGNLATRDGVLLVAGYGGAAFKRDGKWTVIFHDHALRELAAKSK
jgi:hypothetical protein